MPKTLMVRFLNNFIMTVIQTVVDENDKLVIQENDIHICVGDVYNIVQYERHSDDRVDLHFPDSSPLAGVAHNVEGDYCEIREPHAAKPKVVGCGGCGGNK